MFRFLKIALCAFFFAGITSQAYAISIDVDDFFINVDDSYEKGSSDLDVGSSWDYTANGGVSAASIGSFHTTASADYYWPPGWYEYSESRSFYIWEMEFNLNGAPGETAEIVVGWNFWLASVVTAYPSGLFPSGSYSKAVGQVGFHCVGINEDGIFIVDRDLFEEETIAWIGVDGDDANVNGSVSLGIFPVNGPLISLTGFLYGDSVAYANPYGKLVSNLYCGFEVDITPYAINPEPIPEPSTVFLLCSGLVGLVGFRRKLRQK